MQEDVARGPRSLSPPRHDIDACGDMNEYHSGLCRAVSVVCQIELILHTPLIVAFGVSFGYDYDSTHRLHDHVVTFTDRFFRAVESDQQHKAKEATCMPVAASCCMFISLQNQSA